MKLAIDYVTELPEDIGAKMSAGLAEYEAEQGVSVNYDRFSLLLKDSLGEVLGVLNGYTAYAEIYIDDLWIESTHRGKGYGSMLIQSLEQRYSDLGFNNINLVTSEFQAPDFYRKCGFTEEFTRVNVQNPKLNKTFFVKFFENEVQIQGLPGEPYKIEANPDV
jgi:GNAT superfamily N-acetyltransferase